MLRSFAFAALALLSALAESKLAAETPTTAAPPAWQDGASVYLTMNQGAALESEISSPPAAVEPALPASTTTSVPEPNTDTAVAPAIHTTEVAPTTREDRRRLAPPSNPDRTGGLRPFARDEAAGTTSQRSTNFGLPLESLYTMFSALAIVIGAFLVCAWLLKRGAARKGTATLPADVVSVLGRVPLAARQFAELLRVGNKLVLITLTPTGAATLTEVTDPPEVDRLVGLCQQSHPHSTTKAFEQVFRQMSLEPARSGFLGDASPLPSLQSTMDAFRAQRGDDHRA